MSLILIDNSFEMFLLKKMSKSEQILAIFCLFSKFFAYFFQFNVFFVGIFFSIRSIFVGVDSMNLHLKA